MKKRRLDNINYDKLVTYGFILKNDIYYYEKDILNNKFKIVVEIKDEMASKVIDKTLNEEYILVDVESATGNYVGKVREEYDSILSEIINTCTKKEIYKSQKLKTVLEYIKRTYNDKPEFLWKNVPTAAAIRNKMNNKWYMVIMSVVGSKIGLDSNEEIEIIDIRYNKDRTNEVIDNVNIFPAWHMNKKSWITINLNSELDNEIIYSLIDNSYDLSLK